MTVDEGGRRGPLTATQRRWLFGILAVAAVLRLVWFFWAKTSPPGHFMDAGDQFSYWYYGNEIAGGRGYVSYVGHEATAYYPIGYPTILAGIIWVTVRIPFVDPDLLRVLNLVHVVVSVATVALVFVVGRRLLGVRAALVAAALMAGFPNLIFQVTTLQLETMFIFTTMAALAIIVDHDWSSGPPSTRRLLAFGAVLAVSATIRPFSLPMLVGLLLALVSIRIGWRRLLAAMAVPVIVLIVAFTPWTIRNAVRFDAFIPSSTNMGDTLCLDRHMNATGGFQWADHDGCVDDTLPEVERNQGNTRKAIEFIVDHPDRELLQILRRAKFMFEQDHEGLLAVETMGKPIGDSTYTALAWTADWYFFAVLAGALVGLPVWLRRTPRPERWLTFAPAVGLLVIPLLLWGTPRFHLPLLPFFALFASALTVVAVPRRAPATEDGASDAGGATDPVPVPT